MFRIHDQMSVVGHYTIGQKPHIESLYRLFQNFFKLLVIFLGIKNSYPSVSAVNDMIDIIANINAFYARHTGVLYHKMVADPIFIFMLPDTEKMKKEIMPEQLSIPEEFQPYFNGYHACYAFIQLTYTGEPTGYYFNWREYCKDEQREWIESWHVIDGDGQLNKVES